MLADYLKTIEQLHNDIFSPITPTLLILLQTLNTALQNACLQEHKWTYTFPATRRQVSLLEDIRHRVASMEGVGG